MMALQSFFAEKGFNTDWPQTDRVRERFHEQKSYVRGGRGHALNLEAALEEADKLHAIKTGKPVGEFSRKIEENTAAQENGARLKGRRTL